MLTSLSTPDASKPVVNSSTEPKRRKTVENKQYAAFLARAVRAFGKRVAEGDVESLRDLLNVMQQLDNAINVAVVGLRNAGYSWAEIADRIGVTKQTAQERWGGGRK